MYWKSQDIEFQNLMWYNISVRVKSVDWKNNVVNKGGSAV